MVFCLIAVCWTLRNIWKNFFFESINFYTLFLCVARQWRMVKECTAKSVTGGLWVFVFMRCCLGRHHFMLSLSLKPIAELCSTRWVCECECVCVWWLCMGVPAMCVIVCVRKKDIFIIYLHSKLGIGMQCFGLFFANIQCKCSIISDISFYTENSKNESNYILWYKYMCVCVL